MEKVSINKCQYLLARTLHAEMKPSNLVEVCLKNEFNGNIIKLRHAVFSYLLDKTVFHKRPLIGWQEIPELSDAIDSIWINEVADWKESLITLTSTNISLFCYTLYTTQPIHSVNEDNQSVMQQTELPNAKFVGLWESLCFEEPIQQLLISFMQTLLLFVRSHISPSVISNNQMILLHGPPGCGKTTLARSLAQKLSIRFAEAFINGAKLLEVNCHGLFSKYFSESGKMVGKMCETIAEIAADRQTLVIVLIDEVESLTLSREAALGGKEPSDAVRVVNALLTSLDTLKSSPNILFLFTTNLLSAIDTAFLDRADIVQWIGPPCPKLIYGLMLNAIVEMYQAGLMSPIQSFVDWESVQYLPEEMNDVSKKLCKVAKALEGKSARWLTKLPLLVFAKAGEERLSIDEYLDTIFKIIN